MEEIPIRSRQALGRDSIIELEKLDANQSKNLDYTTETLKLIENGGEENKFNSIYGIYSLQKQIHLSYSRNEKPLDLFLEGSYENGKRSLLPPLSVYIPIVEPVMVTKDTGKQTFVHFDEKSYKNVIRDINQEDGFLGYYSQKQIKKKQVIQILVCVTMYCEDRTLLEKTLYSIYRNLQNFKKIGILPFQIVVVVIQDGIMKMNKKVIEFYDSLEIVEGKPKCNLKDRIQTIQDQLQFLEFTRNLKSELNANEGLPKTIPKRLALVYQNRFQFIKDKPDQETERPVIYNSQQANNNLVQKSGLTVLSVFKHKQAKKLSSHLWFFEGFCRQLNPKYCALIDVGTMPAPDGLLKFYLAMEGDPQIGGVCGFLGLYKITEYEYAIKPPEQRQGQQNEQKKQIKLGGTFDWKQKLLERKKIEHEKQQKEEADRSIIDQKQSEAYIEKQQKINQNIKEVAYFEKIFFLFFIIKFLICLIPNIIEKILDFTQLFDRIRNFSINFTQKIASLFKAQVFEYTMLHMVDKNFESLLGYIQEPRGSWSAYRYTALNVRFSGQKNLIQKKYLKQFIDPDSKENNIRQANTYLNQDRILSLGVFCQPNSAFKLKYIPDAFAYTDPIEHLEEFINQRRRWINSSYFGLDYVLKHFYYQLDECDHNSWYKYVLVPFNMLFARIADLIQYFIPAFYIFITLNSRTSLQEQKSVSGMRYILNLNETDYYYYAYNQTDIANIGVCNTKFQIDNNRTYMCDSYITNDCYETCKEVTTPNFIYILLDIVPMAYITTFALIIIASLNFKIKRVTDTELVELGETIITKGEDVKNLKDRKAAIVKMERELQKLNRKNEMKEKRSGIKREKKDLKNFLINKTTCMSQEIFKKIRNHEFLTKENKRFKIKYDSFSSQQYANDIFKILAMVMSVLTTIVIMMVGLLVLMNLSNSGFGIKKNFTQLDDQSMTQLIVMVALFLGSNALLILAHFIFQRQLILDLIYSSWSFLVYQPIYYFILIPFSFGNLDDTTWGTKGIEEFQENPKFYEEKVKFVTQWLVWNTMALLGMVAANILSASKPYVILIIGFIGTFYTMTKLIFALISYLKYFLHDKVKYWMKRKSINQNQVQQEREQLKDEYQTFLNRRDSFFKPSSTIPKKSKILKKSATCQTLFVNDLKVQGPVPIRRNTYS